MSPKLVIPCHIVNNKYPTNFKKTTQTIAPLARLVKNYGRRAHIMTKVKDNVLKSKKIITFAIYKPTIHSAMKHLIYMIILVAHMMGVSAAAQDFEAEGIYYSINQGKATVTSGTIFYSGDVVIPAAVTHDGMTYPVTAIAHSAFRNCTSLKSVSFPASITTVGEHAFAGCTSIDSVEISDLAAWCDITFDSRLSNPCYLAHRLFLNGEEIIDLVIPDTVTSIGSYAFTGCMGLNSVHIPSSVTEIGVSVFANCPEITSMTVDDGNTVYDSRDACNAVIVTSSGTLIAGCQNTVIPGTVTSIGDYAFSECTMLRGINIPNSVTRIGLEAFYRCSSLISANIPNSVTVIGYQAFYGCSALRSVHIPASVRGIASSAFEYCPSITSMTVASGNPQYDSREDCNAIIETVENRLIAGCMNTVIPATVTAIDDYAFSGCSELSGMEIPPSVVAIGDYAFRSCSKLRRVVLPASLVTIGVSAFFDCTALNSISIPATVSSIGAFAFERCPALVSMVVDSANSTYDSRQNCNAIIETATNRLIAGCMNTTVPATVTAIGDNAFSGCFMLTEMDLPKSVTRIGDYAFTGCSSLASINIPTSVKSIGYAAFNGCSALTSLDIPNSVVAIGPATFGGCVSLTSINLPKSVTVIGDHEFYGCVSLASVGIPRSVTSIGNAAFSGCISLTGVSLPSTLTSIGSAAFRGCSALRSINIPAAVSKIGLAAFRGCHSLSSINVATGNGTYDSRQGCNAIIETATGALIAGCKKTVIPGTVRAIGYSAFDGCTALKSITIPMSVVRIGKKAFQDCSSLKDVTCQIIDPAQVIVAADAFRLAGGDYSVRTLRVPGGTASVYQSVNPWCSHFGNIVELAPAN